MPSLLQNHGDDWGEKEDIPFSNENLLEFKRKLTKAEEAFRNVDKQLALEEYLALGEFFMEQYQQYSTGAYFFKKTIKIAKLVNN